MTETRFTWRWLVVIALVGIFMGLAIGLAAGWLVAPTIGSSNISDLSTSIQKDYIVLVANTYAYDQDDARAKQRLAQLQDKDIKTRVERLAKELAARKDPSAANVADLALGLGSEDSSLQVLAAQVSNINDTTGNETEPTKMARSDAGSNPSAQEPPATSEPTTASAEPTVKPTKIKKNKAKATPEPQAAPTNVPATKIAATKAPTSEPTQAAPPPPSTIWLPPLKSDWPTTAFFRPANVSPGQIYWRLVKAQYCDAASDGSQDGDGRNGCQEMAGGPLGVGTYVILLNADGTRAEAEMNVLFENGAGGKVGSDIISPKDPGDPCACNYSWESSNYLVQVDGASDAVGGLCLCSRYKNFGSRSHVRFFFWFQRTTR